MPDRFGVPGVSGSQSVDPNQHPGDGAAVLEFA